MGPSLTTWISVPLIGAFIGYVTNWLAVKMIFRPIKPRSFLGIRVQGLIGRRQKELAASIGKTVGNHLISHKDIVKAFNAIDFSTLLSEVLDKGLQPQVTKLRALPLIGGFLTQERVAEIRQSLVDGILQHKELIRDRIEPAVEKSLDIRAMVADKVSAFPVEKLESLILEVSHKELRAIEWLGGVLGGLIGLGQVAIVWAFPGN